MDLIRVVEVRHFDFVTVVKFHDDNERELERAEFELCFDSCGDPYVVVGAHVSPPEIEGMHFRIVKIGPAPIGVDDGCASGDVPNGIELRHMPNDCVERPATVPLDALSKPTAVG